MEAPQNVFVIIKANKDVSLYLSDQSMTGVLSFKDTGGAKVGNLFDQTESLVTKWSMKGLNRRPFCFKVHGETKVYSEEKVIDGIRRPFAGPHMWISEPINQKEPEWLKLKWDKPILVSEIHLTFNDDVNEDLINLHHHRTPFEVIPELVKDYRIQIKKDDGWETITSVKNNRQRKRIHQLDEAVRGESIRIIIEATNGCPRAELIEIRVYE